jgi:hypothetical protein
MLRNLALTFSPVTFRGSTDRVAGGSAKEQTLGRCVNAYKARQGAGDGVLSETDRAKLTRLGKENSELKMPRRGDGAGGKNDRVASL